MIPDDVGFIQQFLHIQCALLKGRRCDTMNGLCDLKKKLPDRKCIQGGSCASNPSVISLLANTDWREKIKGAEHQTSQIVQISQFAAADSRGKETLGRGLEIIKNLCCWRILQG